MYKNYPVLVRSMLYAGAVCTVVGLLVHDHTVKGIFVILSVVFYLSGCIQLFLFKKKPQFFDDKKTRQ
jgi:hypothetical protein